MSTIKFSGDIDLTSLDAGIKKSNQNVGEWSKGIEQATAGIDKAAQKAGQSMGDFASQSAAQMKESIAIQKQAVKELETELNRLQEIQGKSTGRSLSGANVAVGKTSRELAGEKATLIQMEKEQATAVAASTEQNLLQKESQGGLVNSLGKWVMGLATVAAAMRVGKAVIDSTETTAHIFEQTTTAAASAVGVFFKAIATGDWSNFRQGMDRAVQGALDYVDAMEKLTNMQNEQKIKSSKYDVEIGKQRANSFSADPEVVKKALTELVKLQKLKLTEEADLVKKEYDISLKKAADDNNIDGKQLQQKIEYYSQYRDIIEKGEAYNLAVSNNEAAIRGRNDYGGEKRYQENQKALEGLKKELGSNATAYAKIATDFSKVPIPNRSALADQLAKANTAFAAIDINNRRDKQRLVGIQKTEDDAANSAAKKALETRNKAEQEQADYETAAGRKRLDKKFAIEQSILDLQKDSAEKQRQQADLDFRKSLNEIAKQQADELKAYNKAHGGTVEVNGKTVKTGKFVNQLPGEDQAQFDQEKIIAAQKQAATLVQIDKDQAEKMRVIEDELYNYRLTGIEKEKEAVKDKYDKEEKLALAAMRFDLVKSIGELRGKANAEIDSKYALQEIDYQEQLEIQKAKLSITNEKDLQDELFNIWVRNQNKRIVELNKGQPEDKKKAIITKGDVAVETNLKSLEKEKKLRQEITNAVSDLTGALVKNGKLSQDAADGINMTMTMISKLASGDYLGAAITLLSSLFQTMPTEAELFAEKITKINDLLKEQQRLIDLSSRTGGEADALKAELVTLKQRHDLDLAELDTANKMLEVAKKRGNEKDAQKRVDDLTAALKEDQNAIDDAQQKLDDFLSGGITQNTIADQIAQGFQDGKTSIDDFASYMNKVLLDAVLNIFKSQFLLPAINSQLMPVITAALGDNIITQDEKDNIDRITKEIADKNKGTWDQLSGALGLTGLGSAGSTLTGSIQRDITEKQAGELAGLFRKTSDDTRRLVDWSKVAINHFAGIEQNTFNTVDRLDKLLIMTSSIQVDINTTAKNTKPVSVKGTGV